MFNPLKRLTLSPKHHLVDPALAARLVGVGKAGLLRGDGNRVAATTGTWPAGLANAVELLTGPVLDHRLASETEAALWARAQAIVEQALLPSPESSPEPGPDLLTWWQTWCARGGFKRAARAEAMRLGVPVPFEVAVDLAERLSRVLRELPAAQEPIAVLARRTLGDAHGLDGDRPLGRLAATVVAEAFKTPGESSRRETWARAGVVLSNVSSTVLCLGVSGVSAGSGADNSHPATSPLAGATATALTALRGARTPVVLTLDQVRSGGVAPLPPDAVVHLCENPTVLEVAAHRWATRPDAGEQAEASARLVLVCTGGQPSTAVLDLVDVLTSAGAECRYHGDFDWGGLRIAATVRQRIAWTPWRYTASDYLAAVETQGFRSRHLTGRPAPSSWDPALADVMTNQGWAIEEEAVTELLVADLLPEAPERSVPVPGS